MMFYVLILRMASLYLTINALYANASQWENSICQKTYSKFESTNQLLYLAVIASTTSDNILLDLPLPSLIYSNNPSADYPVVTIGFPSSTYIKFIVDHFTCVPRWVLFFDNSKLFHTLHPSTSSSLLDLNRMDRGYVALGHIPPYQNTKSTHPASEGFSAGASPQNHKAAYISMEVGQTYYSNIHKLHHFC